MKSAQAEVSTKSKKILVNPLIMGNGIHFNKGKYTIASSTCGVKESSSNITRPETVHYNPKFLQPHVIPRKENVHINPNYLKKDSIPISNAIYVNPNFLNPHQGVVISTQQYSFNSHFQSPSKYKYVRKESAPSSTDQLSITGSLDPCQEPKCVSKYKLVYSTAPSTNPQVQPKSSGIQIKSKYSIRTCQPNVASSSIVLNCVPKKRLSKDFKRISRTKLVRKSVLKNRRIHKGLKMSYQSVYYRRVAKMRKHRYKLNRQPLEDRRSRLSSECSSFKMYSRTKIVRKSILRAQIDSRKLTRKTYRGVSLQPFDSAKYKFFRKDPTTKIPATITKRSLIASKYKKRKSLVTKLTAKLRKNNQLCLFYNRFGRCKGKSKGTCQKIHDPLYVAVCKKLPFGECTDKTCLLSHDVRPGKMPTCYHYLAGLCQRDNCPYLHIKVNSKAPVCRSFLQGYCPDVFKCLKRHEYICPIFAEKGNCPKGKSCIHPHKIPTVQSKLLTDHQLPLMAKKMPAASSVPNPHLMIKLGGEDFSQSHPPLYVLSDDVSNPTDQLFGEKIVDIADSNKTDKTNKPSLNFTRYFALPSLTDPCKNDEVELEKTS